MTGRGLIVLVACLTLAGAVGEAWARAGSGGSRGSRSYSSPARPAPVGPDTPSVPSLPAGGASPSPLPRPSALGGLMGALGGFMVGGLLGGLLFGGVDGSAGGFGFFDLLLIGGGVFVLFRLMQSRRREPAYAGAAGYGGPGARSGDGPAGGAVVQAAPVADDLDRGLGHIQQMDPAFDAAGLAADAAEIFRAVQIALAAGDVGPVRARLTPEMLTHLQAQADSLRREGRTNRLERVQVERAEVTEAWQERGRDFVTVLLSGSLIDYVVDAAGAVVTGSRTTPGRFEDFWTFTRPVGPNAWALTAIQTG